MATTKTLNSAEIDAVARGLQTKFNKLYAGIEIGPMAQLFETFDSDGPGENYPVFGAVPGLSVFNGTREFTGIRADGMYIANVEYDAGIEVPRMVLERDKLGQYNGRIAEMAKKAKTYVVRLIGSTIQNGTSATLAKCWDGKALFSTTHGKEKGATNSNLITGSGVDTLAHVQDDVEQVIAALSVWEDDKGDYVGAQVPNIVLYPAANYGLAKLLRTIRGAHQGLDQPDQSEFMKFMIPIPEMTGNSWAMAIGTEGMKPFGFQVEKDATAETNFEFKSKAMQMSIEMRAALFCGDPSKIARVTNS